MPKAAPQPKEGEAPPEQPKSIAGLLGNLFGGSQAEAAQPAAPAPSPDGRLARQEYESGGEAEACPGDAHRLDAGGSGQPSHVTRRRPSRKTVAKSAPAKPQAPAPEMRTAYSAPQSDDGGLAAGAQPVVPAGSFESRWTALR